MNLIDALNLFQLDKNYTDDDVEKKYSYLLDIYHLDENKSSDDVVNIKDINEARDLLIKLKKDINDYTKDFILNLLYRKQKIDELLLHYYFDLTKFELSDILKSRILRIRGIIDDFAKETVNCDKKTIDNMFDECKNKIKNILKELKDDFFSQYYIREYYVKENINYDCLLMEFYYNLLKIRLNYNSVSFKIRNEQLKNEKIIMHKLDEETKKYKSYYGYKSFRMKNYIEVCKNNTLAKIIKKDFEYSKNDIEEMHKNIIEGFGLYYIVKKEMEKLDSITANIGDRKIRNEYCYLNERMMYEENIKFSEIKRCIKELYEMIDKYNIRKTEFEKNKLKIDEIFKLLIYRACEEMKNYGINSPETLQIHLQLSSIKKIFSKGCKELMNLDYFNLFNEITFRNIENDKKIKEMILRKLYPNYNFNLNKSYIYIEDDEKKTSFSVENDKLFTSFNYLEKDGLKLFKFSFDTDLNKVIDINPYELVENYISLDELLNMSEYVGEWMMNFDFIFPCIYIYYKSDEYIIFRFPSSEIYIAENTGRYYKCEKEIIRAKGYIWDDELRDKKVMLKFIEDQKKERVEKIKSFQK